MNDKKAIWIVIAGMISLLCFSCYIVLKEDSLREYETIVILGGSSASEYETTETPEKVQTATSETTVIIITASTEQVPAEIETPTEKILWININTASVQELSELNGIGETIANSIIEYREQNGAFRNIEELMNINGIGEIKFNSIRDHIYVENPYYEEPEEDYYDSEYNDYEQEPDIDYETSYEEPERTLEEESPININTADADELMLLPYVTEEIAERIIELRNDIGGYSHPYELLYIEELEQKEVAEIIEFVTVGQ